MRLLLPEVQVLPRLIRGPFENAQLRQHFKKSFPDKLTNDLVAEIKGSSESGTVNLWVVQIVCYELWQSPSPEALFGEKHVRGLVEDYLNRALDTLAARKLKDPAIALLSALVTPIGARNVISEYSLIEQVKGKEPRLEGQLQPALTALVTQTKLVRSELQRDDTYYEILSEFLSPWIMKQRQERLAQQEETKQRAFEASLRRKKLLINVGLVMLAALLLGLVSSALYLREVTRQQVRREQRQALEAMTVRATQAEQRAQDLSAAKGQAEQARNEALQRSYQALALQEAAGRERDEALRQRDEAFKHQPVVVVQKGEAKTRRPADRRPKMFGS